MQRTPPQFRARALQLGTLLLQLARVCVWSAVADVGDGDVSRSSLVAWREASSIVVKGDSDASTAVQVLDLAASLHLHRIMAVLKMRPIWTALDALLNSAASKGLPLEEPAAGSGGGQDLSVVCRPLVDRMLGYETVANKAHAARPVPVQGSYMDVIRTCVNDKCLALSDEVGDPYWRRRWCAHAVGIAAVVSDDALGLLEDVSSECLEDLLHKDLAFFSLHLMCDEGAPDGR